MTNPERDTYGDVVIACLILGPFVIGWALGVVMVIRLGWQ